MLVLSRKVDQGLIIGDDVEITILESKDGIVKIGINAPKHVKIYRKEILAEIKDENKEAMETDICMLKKVVKGNK